MAVDIRPAEQRDALALAALLDISGGGLPAHVWSERAAGQCSLFEVARSHAMREDQEAGFSYRHATVATFEEEVVAMILGYRQPNRFDPAEIEAAPAPLRPVLELVQQAPGSFYLHALAVFPDFRRQKIGDLMLDYAEKRAWRDGATSISLVVSSENQAGVRLYEGKGYAAGERRPVLPYAGMVHGGDWVLYMKNVSG